MSPQASSSGRPYSPEPYSSLDMVKCEAIGHHLADVRASRGLSVNDVSRQLLLSSRQVRALESVDFTAFHNEAFYLAGLKKYSAMCGLDPATVVATITVTKPETVATKDQSLVAHDRSARISLRRWGVAGALTLCAIIGATWALYRPGTLVRAAATNGTPTSPAAIEEAPLGHVVPTLAPTAGALAESPAATIEPSTEPSIALMPRTERAEPAPNEIVIPPIEGPPVIPPPPIQEAARAARTDRLKYGSVHITQKAWMFLRQSDNTVIERTVAAGATVELPAKPRYLAVGNGEATLMIGERFVDTSRFVRNGTLRMGIAEFTSAEQSEAAESTPAR